MEQYEKLTDEQLIEKLPKRDYWNIQIKYWAQMPGLYVTVVRADSGNLLL